MKYLDAFGFGNRKLENFLTIFDNCFENNAIDRFEWKNLKRASKRLQAIEAEGRNVYDRYENIMLDMFLGFYKIEPKFEDKLRVSQEAGMFNKAVMEHILNMSRYEELKVYTVGDELNTGVALVSFSEELKEIVKDKVEEIEEQRKALEELKNAIKEAIKNGDFKTDEDLDDETKQKIQEYLEALDEAVGGIPMDLGELSEIMDSVLDSAEENEVLKRTWGLNQNDSFMRLPYEKKLEIFEKLRNSQRFKDVTDMLGRFKALANKEKSERVSTTFESLEKLKRSNEIEHSIPSELTKLADEDLEWLLWRKMADHTIDTYDYEVHEDKRKGPIIVCIDESGSMMGECETWSKACAMAITHQAKLEKRSVFIVHFSFGMSADTLKVNTFPGDEGIDMEELIDMVEHFYNGGTSFDQPIERTMSCVDTEEEFTRADGVFITDGWCEVNPDIKDKFDKFKKENNFSMYGILIGAGGYGGGSESLKEFCDHVYDVDELTNELFLDVSKRVLD